MDRFFAKELPKNRKKSLQVHHNKIKKATVKTNENTIYGNPNTLSKPRSQSYLDFGQKSFGKSIACPKCNMLYVLGVEEDEKNHRKHCRSRQLLHIDSLSIQTLRHEWEPRGSGGSSSSSRGAEEPCNRSAGKNNQHIEVVWENIEKHVSIIKINMDSDAFRNSSKLSAQRWRTVVGVILTEMGAHDRTLEEVGCSLYLYVDTLPGVVLGMIISEQVHQNDLHLFCPKSIYLPSTNGECEGIRTKENILPINGLSTKQAFANGPFPKKQKLNNAKNSARDRDCEKNGEKGSAVHKVADEVVLAAATSCNMPLPLTVFSQDYTLLPPHTLLSPSLRQALSEASPPLSLPAPFTVGVKQMWVSALHRRQGIARQLLECIRTSASTDSRCPLFIPSHERFKISFSQPTSDGLQCALRYVAPAKVVWLYSRSSVNGQCS